jgi:hypothetical protein
LTDMIAGKNQNVLRILQAEQVLIDSVGCTAIPLSSRRRQTSKFPAPIAPNVDRELIAPVLRQQNATLEP